MRMNLVNFGRFANHVRDIENVTAANGFGKTTFVNAYIFALTGKVLNGFAPRTIGISPDLRTEVIIDDFPRIGQVRRMLNARGGTELYINSVITTQVDFNVMCEYHGINIQFAVMCANVNVLTNPDLSSETLRSLLTLTDVMDGDEPKRLRKELENIRKLRNDAEIYAVSNVVVPVRTVEQLSTFESAFLKEFRQSVMKANETIAEICTCCGQKLSPATLKKRTESKRIAIAQSTSEINVAEANRLDVKERAYIDEIEKIRIAETAVSAATKARNALVDYDKQIVELDKQIRTLEANAVNDTLPEGVEVITEVTGKTSKTSKSVCTLTYNGIPLKSVNKAKRIEICVHLLNEARTRNGLTFLPIILDNAESIRGNEYVDSVPNLIRFSVSQS